MQYILSKDEMRKALEVAFRHGQKAGEWPRFKPLPFDDIMAGREPASFDPFMVYGDGNYSKFSHDRNGGNC